MDILLNVSVLSMGVCVWLCGQKDALARWFYYFIPVAYNGREGGGEGAHCLVVMEKRALVLVPCC